GRGCRCQPTSRTGPGASGLRRPGLFRANPARRHHGRGLPRACCRQAGRRLAGLGGRPTLLAENDAARGLGSERPTPPAAEERPM
ncbi:MAG: hypothetical protein AVDCRST_MAG04-3006, partial [uncultured Acetobacteraceae bacterium]